MASRTGNARKRKQVQSYKPTEKIRTRPKKKKKSPNVVKTKGQVQSKSRSSIKNFFIPLNTASRVKNNSSNGASAARRSAKKSRSRAQSRHRPAARPEDDEDLPELSENSSSDESSDEEELNDPPPKPRPKPQQKQNQLKPQRRLRSTAPIYELIDTILENHGENIKSIDTETYVCKCGTPFRTTSYRKRNFDNHLKRDARLKAKNPWSTARISSTRSKSVDVVTPSSTRRVAQPTNVCQGFYLRQAHGVDITDQYHVQVDGKEGFYGIANHRAYVPEGEFRGTYKSVFCTLTGLCIMSVLR